MDFAAVYLPYCVGMFVEQWLGVRRMLNNKRLVMGCMEGDLLYSQVHRGG